MHNFHILPATEYSTKISVGKMEQTINNKDPSVAMQSYIGCFFVYDNFQAEREQASEEELMLYFYPPTVPIRQQVMLTTGYYYRCPYISSDFFQDFWDATSYCKHLKRNRNVSLKWKPQKL